MAPRHVRVFFYGLFMDEDALRAKGTHPMNPRRARVGGFALRLGQRATLVPDPGAWVHGVVMELSHEEIERLYAEPGVREYRPEAVIADVAGESPLPALCFNLPAPGSEPANQEYARQLREAARRAGLPESYIKSIG